MNAHWTTAAALFLLIIGCSRSDRAPTPKIDGAMQNVSAPSGGEGQLKSVAAFGEEFVAQEPAGNKPGAQGVVSGQTPAGTLDPKHGPKKIARKIRYTADLKLITDQFDRARDELQQLIAKHQGYEAMAEVRSSPGTPRVGQWRVRVPIEKFADFRQAIRKLADEKLAEVEVDTVNTEDLTEQYYDLEANIKNLKAEQESWRDMLKRTTDKVENLIAVKRELDRVTDEIQRKEGRLRLMANLTELTTVNLSLRERQRYTPDKGPELVEAATFGMRAGKTFENSWSALRGFGEGVALFAIGAAPWLPLILLVIVPCWCYVRRVHRAMPSAAAPPAAT